MPTSLLEGPSNSFLKWRRWHHTGRNGLIIATLLVFALVLPTKQAYADDFHEDRQALALRENVVKIKATLRSGSAPREGFGFIVGKQGDSAVIVTANHVVRDEDDPDALDRSPHVTFYSAQGTEAVGTLQVGTSAPVSRGDIAIILAPWPAELSFVANAQAGSVPNRGESVWPIGRGGDWNVPVNPGRITSQDPVDRHLEIEGLNVAVGSSGGPLVSKEGIVGMITDDNTSYFTARATSIQVIEQLVRDSWRYNWGISKVTIDSVPSRFNHATGYFIKKEDKWFEYPPYPASKSYPAGNFSFTPQGVVDNYLYLADPSRVQNGDQNRPFMLRIPVQGGMAQWSFPNPFVWQDLYVVNPASN